MEYTSDYINSLSFAEYIKLMATELNENGFKENGQYEYCSFENDPAMQRLFMMGPINDPKAMAFLKSKGLIENGTIKNEDDFMKFFNGDVGTAKTTMGSSSRYREIIKGFDRSPIASASKYFSEYDKSR